MMDVVNLLITSRSCPASGWAILLPSAKCNSWLLNEELITSSVAPFNRKFTRN
ncbi:hypothetical protein AVDCRST_MAG84-7007 [uncultured Microcoleus sp.]|uniref:Uncharacterized protein n=1 Tax=uncultured Microcoleus sp. TaxID=259945 RepID=A0A6J4PPI7_9CYAN|nr:hypothetical protein AVDCRST_MAG84-7007 [uncultured Microcoleus sp.]